MRKEPAWYGNADLPTVPNFPDEMWARLKTWAKAQATSNLEPSIEECEAYVRHVCGELTSKPSVLGPDAVAFYAREARDMIVKFRATVNAEGGVA